MRIDLDDGALLSTVTALARQEREARADFIVHLAEVDRRRLYLGLGFPSLFAWLTEGLGLSKASAFRRVTAARLCARLPDVAAFLKDGRISLTKLAALREVLQPDDYATLLERAAAMSEREVEALALSLDPSRAAPPPRDVIRPLPPPPPAAAAPTGDLFPVRLETPATSTPAPAVGPAAEPREVRHQIQMVVGAEFLRLLEDVRAELSHSHPGAPIATLLGECMKLALAARRRRSRAAVKTPRDPRPKEERPQPSRYVPAAVRREVWARDEGRCTFVAADGRRCNATQLLELDHLRPHAHHGPRTAANLRLRCRGHNDHAARAAFGDEHMDLFTRHPVGADRAAVAAPGGGSGTEPGSVTPSEQPLTERHCG